MSASGSKADINGRQLRHSAPVLYFVAPTLILPTTLQASDSNGGSNVITFQRIIVWPVLAHRDARLCFQFLNFKI
jgi:hypothetical protein